MTHSTQGLRIVALLENNPYPEDPRVRPHMQALSEAGYQVTVICPRAKGQLSYEMVNNVRVYRIKLPMVGTRAINYFIEYIYATIAFTFLTLWVWIRHGMDVLHIFNPPDSLFIPGLLPKLAGKKIVYDLRDLSPELYLSKFKAGPRICYSILVWLERMACKLADYIIVVNEPYRQLVLTRDGIPESRVSIIRQGPDLSSFVPGQTDPDLRARAKIILTYLGQISSQDGVEHLIRALHHLDHDFGYTDWLCVIIGRSDTPGMLEELADKLGVSDRIDWTGYLPNEKWIPILQTADIGVEPSPVNPLNTVSTMNKLMDYMAAGEPSVAYDLAEHHVSAGDSALYAIPDDEIDLARQMHRLIKDPELRASMGQVGRRRIEQWLGWAYQKEKLLAVYASQVWPVRGVGAVGNQVNKKP